MQTILADLFIAISLTILIRFYLIKRDVYLEPMECAVLFVIVLFVVAYTRQRIL
jgi:hypothetical protein